MRTAIEPVVLTSDQIRVLVTPQKGCDIRQIVATGSGETVLAESPWTPQVPASTLPLNESAENWMRAYAGGWQLLLPNAGQAAPESGHGFHGGASIASWEYQADAHQLRSRLDCFDLPLRIDRTVSVTGSQVTVRDEVTNTGCDIARFLWNHHPGFGGDLLASEVEINISGFDVRTDPSYDVPGNALAPNTRGVWPSATGKDGGELDLRRPLWDRSALLYVTALATGEASIRRRDGSLGIKLEWSAADFPVCWLWEELGGSRDKPWFGRGRVIGIEPAISCPAGGLDHALATNQPLVSLRPGERRSTTVGLTVELGRA